MDNSNALTIILPDVSSQVTIAADWFTKRDELLLVAAGLTVVDSADSADAAGEQIRKLGKLAKALEDQRKVITDPFLKAQKLIKAKADEALLGVGFATERLKRLVAEFAVKQAKEAEAAARKAEAARREEVERQVAELERKNHEMQLQAQAEAELFGGDPQTFVPPAQTVIVVPEAAPVVTAPKVDGVRLAQALTFDVVNADLVPRQFMTVDLCAIRIDLQKNKDAYIAKMKDEPEWSPIPGVVVKIETKVASR